MRAALVLLLLTACSGSTASEPPPSALGADAQAGDGPAAGGRAADVIGVQAAGTDGAYTFSVEVESPDTGCDRYADWWEITDEAGALLYRRILAHSHVDEQPFTRSGGPVPVNGDETVWIRAHLNTGGYGRAQTGRVQDGFREASPPDGFGASLESTPPLPAGCAF